ncbi:MAG TPA: DUF4936 family protein [Caldimonas sp.]
MRELFVWYRVDERRADAARAAVESMQRSLAREILGLQARLLVRRDADRQTWMETYARVQSSLTGHDGIDADAEAMIAAAALPLGGFIEGDRHVEAFDVAPAR